MYRQAPEIVSVNEALDELADVRMTLNGLATLSLAFAKSEIHEPEANELISCIVGYCALTTDVVSNRIIAKHYKARVSN